MKKTTQTFALPPSFSGEGPEKQLPHVIPNILPCSIQHEGPVPVSKRYWDPICDEGDEDRSTAYFRGRKLRGQRVPIPDGYYGLLATPSSTTVESSQSQGDQQQARQEDESRYYDRGADLDSDADADADTTTTTATLLTPHSTFSHIQIWGHEQLPDVREDAFARGVGEWIRFAEMIHTDSSAALPGGELEDVPGKMNGAQQQQNGAGEQKTGKPIGG